MTKSSAATSTRPTTTSTEPPTGGEFVSPDSLFQIASGFMAAKHLFTANEVGVFTALARGPRRLEELATDTGVAAHRLRILTDAMVVLGLLQRRGEQYHNGPVAATYLSGNSTTDLSPFLRFWDHLSYPMWTSFAEVIRTGHGQATAQPTDDQQRLYSEGVEAIQAAPAHALPASYDFSAHERLLDLGGGTGSWLLAVLHQHPRLRTTLFELPGAAALARHRLADDNPGASTASRMSPTAWSERYWVCAQSLSAASSCAASLMRKPPVSVCAGSPACAWISRSDRAKSWSSRSTAASVVLPKPPRHAFS
jgi:methyltransferase family protein/O-methyltransferase